jgi:hypothetical protein
MVKISKFKQFVNESIEASEAYNTLDSLKTLIDGKRKIAYETENDLAHPEARKILMKLYVQNFRKMSVSGVNNAWIIYHPDKLEEAEELKKIAEKYNGYLHWAASLADHRRIGELLEYDTEDINTFINKMKSKFTYDKNGNFLAKKK